ncbi:histone-fold-containing protein [Lentinula raphanica]|uniref:Histone H2A n=1 Tax=Lentinula raphanica TaxID=153919 RepID=A0AA38PA77_9AGAR|nr:histone-fold-containing protein [Lentinula raphanica]KAJ3771470.1 histone-fold-containing protein [Lentinula raphanica]KAJ3839021.1 histone-fold-containing protein [Lentinula raphanica]KAJ3972928.1 histone-fold-containing protein [Lentinula raphanica]
MTGKTGKSLSKVLHVAGLKKRTNASVRAGLVFPVTRLRRYLKEINGAHKRLTLTAPVYLAAVLEYLVAELLELAGNACRDHRKKTIKPRHILLAIRNDDEIDKLLKDCHITEGGVVPHIAPVLLPGRRKLRFASRSQELDDAYNSG